MVHIAHVTYDLFYKHDDKMCVLFQKNDEITSILGACWWAVATMSTVGYGDVYPKVCIHDNIAVSMKTILLP